MDTIIKSIFLVAGNLVIFLGGWLALLIVGMFPLYVAAYFFFVKKIALRSSMLSYALLFVSAVAMSSVIAMSAVVMGTWG